jgi:hypothetical protein
MKLNSCNITSSVNESWVTHKPIVNRTYTLKSVYNQQYTNFKKLSNVKFFKPVQQINLFNLYLHFSNNISNNFYTPHTNFKPLFISQTLGTTPFININKLFIK